MDDDQRRKILSTRRVELLKDIEDSVALAVEGAFDRYAARGPRVLKVGRGLFAIRRAPRFEV